MNNSHLNTALLTIVLAISGWSLAETTSQGKTLATLVEAKSSSDQERVELRSRLAAAEANVARLNADVAVLQAGRMTRP